VELYKLLVRRPLFTPITPVKVNGVKHEWVFKTGGKGRKSQYFLVEKRPRSAENLLHQNEETQIRCGLLMQARDLAAKDANGLSDPYVRVTLLPDKKRKLETKIKRRTLNPRWNETFYFEGRRNESRGNDAFSKKAVKKEKIALFSPAEFLSPKLNGGKKLLSHFHRFQKGVTFRTTK